RRSMRSQECHRRLVATRMEVTIGRHARFVNPTNQIPLFERAAEIREHPQRDQIDTYQGLETRRGSNPTGRTHCVFVWLHTGDPCAHIQVSPTDVERGEDTEVHTVANCPQQAHYLALSGE